MSGRRLPTATARVALQRLRDQRGSTRKTMWRGEPVNLSDRLLQLSGRIDSGPLWFVSLELGARLVLATRATTRAAVTGILKKGVIGTYLACQLWHAACYICGQPPSGTKPRRVDLLTLRASCKGALRGTTPKGSREKLRYVGSSLVRVGETLGQWSGWR